MELYKTGPECFQLQEHPEYSLFIHWTFPVGVEYMLSDKSLGRGLFRAITRPVSQRHFPLHPPSILPVHHPPVVRLWVWGTSTAAR